MKLSFLMPLFGAVLLLGSALAGDAPLKGFSHDNTQEIFGYYLPKAEIKSGKFRLDTFSIGTLDELKGWESGKDRMPTYAPVMFTFQDLMSKKLKNEMGDTYYANEPRVLPTAYRIKGNTIVFSGSDKQVGVVTFMGTIDLKALKAASDGGTLSTDKVIIKGDLTVAGKLYKGVEFTWFGGD
ncbi:MAG: hypothetical protein JSR60_18885 [Proteobacteria bacterium]|nr:hypothetical protein [Pseudomonadota bacterium]